ncbi:Ref family recombination enhancement nuclease [Enterobacter soli]|uniref:Ref family recombination enhancement nuclease n=1 Tax=Enterobacter soli TaxID=885040 RepID=UPI002F4283AF
MKQHTAEQIEKQREKQRAAAQRAQTRAREKQLERLASPEYREQQRQKANDALARRRTRAMSPEYRAEQDEKKRRKLEAPPAKKRVPTPIRSRGSKGRTPTAEERRFMDAIGKLPCIACWLHGVRTEEISLHHIDGRTKPDAHKKILPLCNCHHQHAAPAEILAIYPWLVPVHASGSIGGRKAFEALNASQTELLLKCYDLAGIAA